MSIWAVLGLLALVVVVISALKGDVRVNVREIEDLEAKLKPVGPGAAAAFGCVEREAWDDGSAELEAWARRLTVPHGEPVEFVIAGVTLGSVTVEHGRARLAFDSRRGDDVPPVAAGQRAELRHAGRALLAGEFRQD